MRKILATTTIILALPITAIADTTSSYSTDYTVTQEHYDNTVDTLNQWKTNAKYWQAQATSYQQQVNAYQSNNPIVSSAETELAALNVKIAKADGKRYQSFGDVLQQTKDDGTYNSASYDPNVASIFTHYNNPTGTGNGTVKQVNLQGKYNDFEISADVDINSGQLVKLRSLIQKVNDKAYNEGYKDGFNDGFEVGYDSGWHDAIDTLK